MGQYMLFDYLDVGYLISQFVKESLSKLAFLLLWKGMIIYFIYDTYWLITFKRHVLFLCWNIEILILSEKLQFIYFVSPMSFRWM